MFQPSSDFFVASNQFLALHSVSTSLPSAPIQFFPTRFCPPLNPLSRNTLASPSPSQNKYLPKTGPPANDAQQLCTPLITTVEMATSPPPPPHWRSPNPNPPWFSPLRLLLIFCAINMLNYVDRGAIASNGVNGSLETCTESGICTGGNGIQGDFKLNYFEDGVLSSAFMVGLLVSSAIFASLAKSHNPFRLIGVGLSVWTFATAGCGFSFDFWSIVIFRMLVGVGEASFVSLAAPFIDDNAPPAQKTAWLAAFYMCIPTGVAVGYVYGGLVGAYWNWRWAFWLESLLMLPFAVLGFIVRPLQLKGFPELESKETYKETTRTEFQDGQVLNDVKQGERQALKNISLLNGKWSILDQMMRFWDDVKVLLLDKVYITNVLGYVAYNFVIGAYAYWGPKAGYAIYNMEDADIVFGAITIVCGIFGTFAGGYVLDRIESTLSNAFKLLSTSTFLGAIFCLGAFFMRSLAAFIVLFSVGELLVFATQAPVNFVGLHCVEPGMRPLSMAMSTVSIHVFGDVPSSPLVGVLQDYLNNWRVTALILTSILFIAAAMWCVGIFLPSVDRFKEDSEIGVPASERSNKRPLLDEDAEESSSQYNHTHSVHSDA